jgi:nucleoredoxin
MKLVKVTEEGGEKVGSFKLRNGKTVTIKASGLSADDAKRLGEWVDPNAPAVAAGPESVFDGTLEGNLVRLDGKSLEKCEDATKPKKFYVFYYTASWCPPCQAFTPSLVEWYNDNKNDNFELVLISSDRDEKAMEGYAKDKKMPWPQLEMKKASKFKGKFDHGVTGIPSLIVCDLEGENLGNFRSKLDDLTNLVKD